MFSRFLMVFFVVDFEEASRAAYVFEFAARVPTVFAIAARDVVGRHAMFSRAGSSCARFL